MGFILKLNRTLPNFTFEILSFDEETNNIEFIINGGISSYNVVFKDQSDNILGNTDGYTYNSDGVKNQTLDAEFGVVTIIGTITDGNNDELTDSIGVNFTTTTTVFEPIVTQINEGNLKFGGFVGNVDGKFGETSPIFNEASLNEVANINDLIIDTTINKLNLLDYDDDFKYEVEVDFSINIQYDGMLASGESVEILIPRIRLELPLNTFRKTATSFQPQFGATSWRMYNVDSIAYELNTITIDNNGATFNANGKVELNIENNESSYITNSVDSISESNDNIILRLNRSEITNNDIGVLVSSIHSDSTISNNTINFTVGQNSKTFTYSPSNGLDGGFYVGSIIRISNNNEPLYLLNSGDVGLAEEEYVSTTTTTSTTTSTTSTNTDPPPPDAPTNATASAYDSEGTTVDSVDVRWTDNAQDETEYRIYRRFGSFNYVLIDTIGINSNQYLDIQIPSATYTYQIAAFNSNGESTRATTNEVTIP